MKKITNVCRLICILLALCFLVFPVQGQESGEDLSVSAGCHSADAKYCVLGAEELIPNIHTAILYEPQTDTMIYAWNPDQEIYPASFVKIMTALVVVENANLSDVVTVRQSVLDSVDDDPDLVADEVISVEDLLYLMLVGASNDASAVLADFVMGSQSAFVAEMNRYAEELGCTATHFVNAHGLHDATQVSTARDILKIMKKATANEAFNKYFCTAHYTLPATNKSGERQLETSNYLMSQEIIEIHYDSRVLGGRTGADTNGFRSVAALAEKDGMRLISIITGAQSVYDENGYAVRSFGGFPETSKLLDYGYDGLAAVQLLYQDQSLRQYTVTGGESDVVIGAASSISTVLSTSADLSTIRFEYSDSLTSLKAPIEKGSVLGTVTLWNGNLCVGSSELYAMNGVDVYQSQTGDSDKNGLGTVGTVLLILAIAAVAFFGVLIAVRWVRIIKNNNRKRRHRRNHRRSR